MAYRHASPPVLGHDLHNRKNEDMTLHPLAERYDTPLPALGDEVEVLASRVDGHLKAMGFVWN